MMGNEANEQRDKEFVIEEVTDFGDARTELEPLLLAMVESQRPHDTRALRTDWAQRWREHLATAANGKFLVARSAGVAVGFLNGSIGRDFGIFDEVPAYVSNLYVEPAFRRMGVGTALFERFEAWSRGQGATSIRLDVIAGNNEGFVFWAVTGFVTSGFSLEKDLEAAS